MPLHYIGGNYYMDEGFYVIRPDDHDNVAPHTHNFVEFVYMFSGRCIHVIDGREYSAKKGDLLFINHNSIHAVRAGIDSVYSEILMKPEFIDESLRKKENAFSLLLTKNFQGFQGIIHQDNCLVHFSDEEQQQVEMLLEWIWKEEETNRAGNLLILRSYLNILLTMAFRKMLLPMQNKLDMDESLLAYIRFNCSSPLSMAQTAQKCGYSQTHFSHLFKKLTGDTFTEYLTKCRIAKARTLLVETDENVDNIFRACGFSDRTKFFRKFTELSDMTPAKYRKTVKSNTNNQ